MRKITAIFIVFIACNVFAQTQYGWVQKSSIPATGRHRSTALSCGNRGYLGLGHINSVVDVLFDDWWEYDPGSDTWSQKANFAGGLRYHAAGFTIGNEMYVGTGRAPSSVLMTDFYKYSPATNTWTAVANFPGAARRGAVAFEINGAGYVGTGSYYGDWYKYNPTLNSWTAIASGPSARISAVGMSLNGKGYCGTGDVGGNTGDWWEYNPTTNQWTQKATLTGLPRMEACGFAFDGKCFVGTGDDYSSGNNYQDFWCWNPTTNSWTQVADFAGSARRYLVALTIGQRVYAGTGTSGMNYNDWWEYGTISGLEESGVEVTVKAYPSPATETVNLEFMNMQYDHLTCVIYNQSGQVVRIEDFVSNENAVIQRNGLASGNYTFVCTENSQFVTSGKFIFE
jgi:N-acetylneuraminic acid mutarotase